MLNYFEEKKETCFDYEKQNFLKSKKSSLLKGLAKLVKKCHFFLLRFGQNKTRNNA